MSTPSLFKWRHFQSDIILLNVRWYCRYALSYRDLEEMMQSRGVEVDQMMETRPLFGTVRAELSGQKNEIVRTF